MLEEGRSFALGFRLLFCFRRLFKTSTTRKVEDLRRECLALFFYKDVSTQNKALDLFPRQFHGMSDD